MPVSVTFLLAAALLGAGPQPPAPPLRAPGVVVASVIPTDGMIASAALDQLDALMYQALPSPPSIVIRKTAYFGTVTIDHRAHLARRAACNTCHDKGPITKITFTARVAHERCIGCHTAQAKGPTKCQGCHVRPPPPPPQSMVQVAAAAKPAAPVVPPDPANVAAALAAYDAAVREASDVMSRNEPFHRWFEVGLAAGPGAGLGVRLAQHQRRIVLTQSIERMSSSNTARTLGLLGAGITRPLVPFPGFTWEAVALAGIDVVDRPVVAFLPALGVRGGLAWRTPFRICREVTASVTGVVNLSQHAYGQDLGSVVVYGGLGTGFGGP